VIGSLFRTGPGEHAFAVSIAVLRTKRRSWAEAQKVSTVPRIVSARDGSESRWIPLCVQLQSCRSFHRAIQVPDKKSWERRRKPPQFGLLFLGIKLGMPAGLSSLVIQVQVFFTIGPADLRGLTDACQ